MRRRRRRNLGAGILIAVGQTVSRSGGLGGSVVQQLPATDNNNNMINIKKVISLKLTHPTFMLQLCKFSNFDF